MSSSIETETRSRPPAWQRGIPWLITLVCFAYLYTRLSSAAAREGQEVVEYLLGTFQRVDWVAWLALMIPYSAFFFLIDSLVVWRVINWFNVQGPLRATSSRSEPAATSSRSSTSRSARAPWCST